MTPRKAPVIIPYMSMVNLMTKYPRKNSKTEIIHKTMANQILLSNKNFQKLLRVKEGHPALLYILQVSEIVLVEYSLPFLVEFTPELWDSWQIEGF